MTDFNKLKQDVQDAETALDAAKATAAGATAAGATPASRLAADAAVKTALQDLTLTELLWEAAIGRRGKKSASDRFSESNMVGAASFAILLIVILVACIFHRGIRLFLSSLAEVEMARGVITAVIVSTTALLAIILIFSAISTAQSDNERSFNRGKEVFTVLVGICGTCVGFCFSTSGNGGPGLTVTGPKVVVSEDQQIATVEAAVTGGRQPWTWQITWDGDGPPDLPSAITTSGSVSVNVPLPKDRTEKITGKLIFRDSSNHSQTLDIDIPPPGEAAPAGGDAPAAPPPNDAEGGAAATPAPPGNPPVTPPAPPAENPAATGNTAPALPPQGTP